jgi:hypothetical protein
MIDSYYMVPVVDSDGAMRVVRALGVDHIATLAAADVTGNVVTRIPQTEGFAERLARLAGDVEMLIGMDNQGWIPVPVERSQLASDNLRFPVTCRTTIKISSFVARSQKDFSATFTHKYRLQHSFFMNKTEK